MKVKEVMFKIKEKEQNIRFINIQIDCFQMKDGMEIIKDLVERKNKLEQEINKLENLIVI